MIIVIGRGHSGTRIISEALNNSGVFMGSRLNKSFDCVPVKYMYQAAKHINAFVKYKGEHRWDFSYLINNEPDKLFKDSINQYLKDILKNDSEHKGWKLPETTFTYPWLTKMFPEAKYIVWNRHPYDSLLSPHKSDRLSVWNVDFPMDKLGAKMRQAVSWKYQYEIVRSTPPPKNVAVMNYEDFVSNNKREKRRLEDFLGFKLNVPKLYVKRVDKWRKETSINWKNFSFLKKPIKKLGYKE